VRRAGAGIALVTTEARSVVVSIGRAATIALAIRDAKRSSPYLRITRRNSPSG
jgi:hypothetical protein